MITSQFPLFLAYWNVFVVDLCIDRRVCINTQDYAELLEVQLGEVQGGGGGEGDGESVTLGRNISKLELNLMNEQQLGQLLELKSETTKPRSAARTDDR